MWFHICQGLLLVGWLARMLGNCVFAARGRPKQEPTGGVGVFLVIVWACLGALILWRAGAVSTIVP